MNQQSLQVKPTNLKLKINDKQIFKWRDIGSLIHLFTGLVS